MKPPIRKIIFSRFSLLVAAILLFMVSALVSRLYHHRASVAREVKLAERYIRTAESDLKTYLQDTASINWILSGDASLKDYKRISKKEYALFLYRGDGTELPEMKFWNSQLVAPPPALVNGKDGIACYQLLNGYYAGIRKTLVSRPGTGTIIAVAMLPVQSDFFIETDYLPRHFFFSSSADKQVSISLQANGMPVRSSSGDILFYLNKKAGGSIPYNDTITNLLRLLSVICLFIFLHFFSEMVSGRKGNGYSILLLASVLLIFRLVIYWFPGLFNLRQFELFDPAIYGFNPVQRSLGDLAINAGLVCWLVLFAWSRLKNNENPAASASFRARSLFAAVAIILLILSTFILSSVVRSFVADSKISFDVTNFFGLNRYTVISFAVLACLALSYYYFSKLLFRFIFPVFRNHPVLGYFAIAIAGLIYLTIRSGHTDVLFYLPVLCWLLAYSWLVSRKGIVINNVRIGITGIISWIFIFSVSMSAIMLVENNKAEWEKRKRMAEKLVMQTDPSSEKLMSIAIKYLDRDFFRNNFARFADPAHVAAFRDSIIASNYSGYLNKYDTRLYVYDTADHPLYNDDSITYETLNTILNVQSRPITAIEGLYYYETSYDRFNYITRRDATDSAGKKMGTVFIVSNPKSFSREALFPELFKQFGKVDPENSPVYSTAVYLDRVLVSQPGNYPFATTLDEDEVPQYEFARRTSGNFTELWYRYSAEKVVVIARKNENAIQAITLFSYIFCSFLFLVAAVQFTSFMLRSGFSRRKLQQLLQLNIRSQVHSTIIFISILSFVIIGIATISFFISRYYSNNSEKLSRTMQIMVNEMEKKLSDHSMFDDEVKLYDSVSNKGLQDLVNDVADIHGVSVNVYDLKGDLKVSSEANVYSKGVLSKKMDPLAYYHLGRLRQVLYIQEERIGNFSYLSIYSPVRESNGNIYAYVNIPYFTSKPELRLEISNFLVTVINLNAFIFLIAGLIALFITNRITGSFSMISDKMKEVSLGKTNEQIAWNRNDEIGELVKEYNKMVTKLEDSAVRLAKSEREGAWREMARQVAHEIKNPLTPMKLSIQYLQKAINNNQDNVKELSANVASTLVEQIDHLSKIAADFSQFANIGNTNVELFDLHDVIASLRDLYEPNPQVAFVWYPLSDKAMVLADRTQMNRLFTNLFTNAVQACPEERICHIIIDEKTDDGQIIISVADNGEGIPEEMRDRIFVPNFTTKSSGTGLGLAMCKGIVEQARGKIWFDTAAGIGTTFYVSLPLAT